MRPKMYYGSHDTDALRYLFEKFKEVPLFYGGSRGKPLGFYMTGTQPHHNYFKKKFMTQKPKYEIGQTVYHEGCKTGYEVIGIQKGDQKDEFIYLLDGNWIYEFRLSPTLPADDLNDKTWDLMGEIAEHAKGGFYNLLAENIRDLIRNEIKQAKL